MDILFGVVRDLMPEGPKYFPTMSFQRVERFYRRTDPQAVFLAMKRRFPIPR